MINFCEYKFFRDNISTLKEQSKDTSKDSISYMTESTINSVDFDLVKRSYLNSLGLSEERLKSVDSLVNLNNGIAFIEFKNGSLKGLKNDLYLKINNSLLIFNDITKYDLTFLRNNSEFILVYNEKISPLNKEEEKEKENMSGSRVIIGDYFMKKAKKEFVRMGLGKYKTSFFRDVHTYSQDEFEQFLLNKA